MNMESFAKLLQMAMLPVVLISAAGLLLLSITNRLGRSIDRARGITSDLEKTESRNPGAQEQLRILVRRSELLRSCALFVALSVFFSCLMILSIFLFVFLGWPMQSIILAVFFLCILCLIISLVYFMADIFLALKALKLNVADFI